MAINFTKFITSVVQEGKQYDLLDTAASKRITKRIEDIKDTISVSVWAVIALVVGEIFLLLLILPLWAYLLLKSMMPSAVSVPVPVFNATPQMVSTKPAVTEPRNAVPKKRKARAPKIPDAAFIAEHYDTIQDATVSYRANSDKVDI